MNRSWRWVGVGGLAWVLVLFLLGSGARGQEVPRAVLLPLDDRPSTLLFTRQVARIGGADLLVPPRNLLGDLTRPGKCDALAEWLAPAAREVEQAIVSSDMLCYGGLIASRTAGAREDLALARLQGLRGLQRPGLRIDVLATIPRLDLRTSDRQAPFRDLLQRWAGTGSPKPPAGVPAEIVQEYLAVRQRNHRVLLALLDLVEAGVVDGLVIGQDDSTPRGLNVKDQEAIVAEVARRGLASRVTLVSGADELAMDMVAGWLTRHHRFQPRIRVEYDVPAGACEVPPMESHPLQQTLAIHLELAGAVLAGEGEAADAVLFVAVPQRVPAPPLALRKQLEARTVTRLLQVMEGGVPVGLADLVYLNRADAGLVAEMMERVPLSRLEAYSGWNTASNALGTAIAQVVTHRVAHHVGSTMSLERALESEKTQQAFLFARLVDEYWYQAVLRDEVRPRYGAIPENADPLLNLLGPAGVKVRSELIPWSHDLFRRHFLDRVVSLPLPGQHAAPSRVYVEAIFPWQRIFEIEVRADMTLEPRDPPGPASPTPSPTPSPAP